MGNPSQSISDQNDSQVPIKVVTTEGHFLHFLSVVCLRVICLCYINYYQVTSNAGIAVPPSGTKGRYSAICFSFSSPFFPSLCLLLNKMWLRTHLNPLKSPCSLSSQMTTKVAFNRSWEVIQSAIYISVWQMLCWQSFCEDFNCWSACQWLIKLSPYRDHFCCYIISFPKYILVAGKFPLPRTALLFLVWYLMYFFSIWIALSNAIWIAL